MELPSSMDDCIYFTRRKVGDGTIIAWAPRKPCPKCKGPMGKPKDPKTGRPKIRSKEYVCEKCSYTEDKDTFEKTAIVNVLYTCPHCKKKGEATTPYQRKTFQGVPSYVFTCEHCQKKIGISKKMKVKKKK